jgi:gliding motility-associated-like protein
MSKFYKLNGLQKVLCFVLLINTFKANAQSCTTPIDVFPYNESFESSNGGWLPGGSSSDWAWGTPTKPVINGAGGGSKCWVTGGLTNAFYNNGENSWLQSPCFDFSNLSYPQISFKIFWETEKKFDGASFQYSIDGGTTWSLVGSINSNSNCQGQNWYNAASLTYLSGVNGWSGNIQSTSGSCQGGGGSNGWLVAKHELTPIAGQSSVMFRFLFGAGSTCNAFDGFAIDDINIAEAPPNTANYDYVCNPASALAVNFNSLSVCPLTTVWDFGDVASGANNASTSTNPSHTFSAPGSYSVKLTATFITGPPSTDTKTITVLAATASMVKPILCNGTSTATLKAIGLGSPSLIYTWDTNPVQNGATITNMPAGTYTVNVTDGNACPASATVVVNEPTAINFNAVASPEKCIAKNGSISTTVTGGTAPYIYLWNNGAGSDSINNLAAGSYSVQVTDANNCMVNSPAIIVKNDAEKLAVNLGGDQSICPGQTLTLNPGSFSSYLWQDNSKNATYKVSITGNYSVTVTDQNGCTGFDGVFINVDCSDIYFPNAVSPNGDTKNDGFGALGNLFAVKNYTLSVYNRYGQKVFITHNPSEKWMATFKGAIANTESYTWLASYTNNGKPYFKKGTVIVVR